MRLFERIALIATLVAASSATRTRLAAAQAPSFDAPAVGAEENAVVDEFVRHMRAWLQVELDTWRAANADGGS